MKPINLNKARKAKARAEKSARADANAVKFGRSKAQRDLEKAKEDQRVIRLDQHKRDE
ncbi:DUF4169 family protein [Nereida sp. MMG025]|uniref:DUF4169 family protein n=1 Tax=Nereida sp. MMG025 TaxID=2909981 RepID=UPI001F1D0B1E|nr:DUF4169 family protein [Nereida sp. MMG025]MCF6443438.1 DUF4169 family protein [Nereida sp. MMG025]